jgi:hypothetical protein
MINDVKFNRVTTLVSKIVGASVLCLMAICFVPSLVAAQANLLLNPDLSAGTGDTPQHWQASAFAESPDDVTFQWHNDQQPSQLEVWNYQPADSRWTQKLHLKPGWYHFTGSVRVENVGEVDFGASINIMEGWIGSRQVHGSGYWEPIGFYLQIPKETDVTFACRLGIYSSVNTGRAFFRNLSATKVEAPANDDPSFKLGT